MDTFVKIIKWIFNIQAIVCAIGAIALLFMLMTDAKAEEPNKIKNCTSSAIFKGAKWSAVYGGTALGLGAAVAVATAPASIPLATAAAVIGANTVTGGLLGAGSSFVTRISDDKYFKGNPVTLACVKKITEEQTKNTLKNIEENAKGVLKRIEEHI